VSYYDVSINAYELFCNKNACESFIHKHFLAGHKSIVLDIDFAEQYKQQGKHEHTVALYLLGLHLQKLFEPETKAYFEKYVPKVEDWYEPKDFMYFWYLTCLYHDVASCVERKPHDCNMCCGHCPKKYFPHMQGKQTIPYSKNTVINYCCYRKDNGKQDHGIYGSIILRQKLYKNFQDVTAGKTLPYTDKYGLVWREEQKDIFDCVAGTIICHNMWTVNASDAREAAQYHELGLDELIISKEEDKLSFKKYPFQFMLCLLDTIEPVKRFKKMSAREVLENVSIEAENDEITIAWTDKMKKQADFWDWMKNISTMKDWMQVDVSSCEREGEWCYVTVTIR
jgi:hypothetical protein